MLGDQLVRFRKQSALNKCCSLNVFWKCELCCQREFRVSHIFEVFAREPFWVHKGQAFAVLNAFDRLAV